MINTVHIKLLKIEDYQARTWLETQVWWELRNQIWADLEYPISYQTWYKMQKYLRHRVI